MKKAIMVILLAVLAAMCSVYTVSAAETAWQTEGCTAAETEDGTVFSSAGGDFGMAYPESFPLSEFRLDLEIGALPESGAANVSVELSGESAGADITLALGAASYDAEFDFGSAGKVSFKGLAYRQERKVQLRIAKESVLNFDTGINEAKWAVRSNGSLDMDSILPEDGAIARFLEQNASARVTCAVRADAAVASIKVRSLAGFSFYDYITLTDGISVSENTLSYERLSLEWALPEGVEAGSLLLERYHDGEKQFSGVLSGLVYSYNDSGLDQGETYSYVLTGYDSQANSVTLCPKILFRYEPLEVQTKAGNPVPIVLTAVIGTFVLVAAVLLYAAWPVISDKIGQRGKKHG